MKWNLRIKGHKENCSQIGCILKIWVSHSLAISSESTGNAKRSLMLKLNANFSMRFEKCTFNLFASIENRVLFEVGLSLPATGLPVFVFLASFLRVIFIEKWIVCCIRARTENDFRIAWNASKSVDEFYKYYIEKLNLSYLD